MAIKWKFLFILFCLLSPILYAYPATSTQPQPAAEQINSYLPLLKNKRVAVFANHSSMIGQRHLVDVLLSHHITIVKIFAPEHGFRGTADHKIADSIDPTTGLPIISLYGKKLQPSVADLQNVDVILFDIQDVGVRFYTYISSLQKLMEAAIENNKPLIILDRPNPNGFYVDGPVLERKYKSFTGMQPIPIVYGMTMGEYAKMLVGEQWLNVQPKSRAKKLALTVIPCRNYSHKSLYVPPVNPSPNLPDIQSIYWYPAIGIMESTTMSVGRGTPKPFQVFGHPAINAKFSFVPTLIVGGTKPLYFQQICYGWNLTGTPKEVLEKIANQYQIKYLIMAYQAFPDKQHFFNHDFAYSAGNDLLQKQIVAGENESEIRASWQPALNKFKKIRQKYLLYEDF